MAWLIDPLAPAVFEQNFYEQRHCHFTRADDSYYANLLNVRNLDVVLGTHDVTPLDISLVRGEDDVPKRAYTDRTGRVNPLRVAEQFDAGATVIFNDLHRRVTALGEFCVSIGEVFGSRVQANVYLTPPTEQGFRPHYDTHDVFVLQIAGHKRWSIYDTKVTLPLRGQAFDRDRDVPGSVTEQFELGPGNAVYIPRGLMHSAKAGGEASIHIALGLTAFTWTDFLLESVAAVALKEESLRHALPLRFADECFPAPTKDRLVREKLETLGSRLAAADVWEHFRSELMEHNTPLFTDVFGLRLRENTLTLTSRMRRRPGLVAEFANSSVDCTLSFCGQELRFPGSIRPAVRYVATTEAFTVHGIPDCLDTKGKITLVNRLVREGLLQAEDAS